MAQVLTRFSVSRLHETQPCYEYDHGNEPNILAQQKRDEKGVLILKFQYGVWL